jgi:aminotransferase
MILEDKIPQVVRDLPPSGIRKFFDIVTEMDDVISLGVGEPDFSTPWHIREAGIYSLEQGHTYYTSNHGILELRQEISKYYKRKMNLDYSGEDEILITIGGSEAIDLAVRALTSPGDEVIIPEPSFVCYKPCVLLNRAIPVIIETKVENKFKLTAKELKEAITDKTKLLILPFPNNPTGAVMTKEDLKEIAEVIKDTEIVVLSDEIYAELTYGLKHVSIANIEGMRERTIIVNGFSKAYAMTGWRLGFAAAPKAFISPMTKIHQYAIMCSPTTSQYAAIEAIKNGDDDIDHMVTEYNYRRKLIVEGFNNMGLDCFEPEGAFYVFPSIKSTGMTSEVFCEKLLFEEKVAVVPGNAFGDCGEGFIRCSYAYSIENIKKALDKIQTFINKLKK